MKWKQLRLMLIMVVSASMLFLVACEGGNTETEQNNSNIDSEKEQLEKEREELEEERQALEDEKKRSEAQRNEMEQSHKPEEKEQEILRVLEDSYNGVGVVDFNEADNTYLILPTDPEFIRELEGVVLGQLPIDDWFFLTDSFIEMSENISEYLGPEYSVMLINPDNVDNMLLWVEDGEIIYDVLQDEGLYQYD